jgi:hypothetical protein
LFNALEGVAMLPDGIRHPDNLQDQHRAAAAARGGNPKAAA